MFEQNFIKRPSFFIRKISNFQLLFLDKSDLHIMNENTIAAPAHTRFLIEIYADTDSLIV